MWALAKHPIFWLNFKLATSQFAVTVHLTLMMTYYFHGYIEHFSDTTNFLCQ
jgi:hypothetical protein